MEFIRNLVNLYHLLSVFNIEADLLCLLSSSTGAVIATIEALFAVTKYGIFFFCTIRMALYQPQLHCLFPAYLCWLTTQHNLMTVKYDFTRLWETSNGW